MLKTRNIYIDTEGFVSNNFFQNENLRRLTQFGNLGTVNIYLTEITKNEIQNNIRENLLNAQNEINKLNQLILNKGKILKNIEALKSYLDLPKLDMKANFDTISEDLERFIKEGKVKFISYDLANIKDVVNGYFTQIPPFGVGKKYEFPDAIVLSAIENWCILEKTNIYIISNDSDMKNYVSDRIIPIPSIKIMLDKIIKQYDNDNKEIEWITEIFSIYEKKITEKIKEAFVEKLVDEIWFDVELKNIEIHEMILHESSLVEDRDSSEYIFQLDFDITFSTDVLYDDYSSSIYDKEDDKYYFYENRITKIEISKTQTAEIVIEAYFEDGENPEDADVSINCTYVSIPNYDVITNELEGYQFTL